MKTLAVSLALAGVTLLAQTSDVLGVHNCYGRGCIACHTPHSGAAGNGGTKGNGNQALWGQNLSPLYGRTVSFGSAMSKSVVASGDRQ